MPKTENDIIEKIKSAIKADFGGVKIRKNKHGVQILNFNNNAFGAIFCLEGKVGIQMNDTRGKIMIDVKPTPNVMFFIALLFCLSFFPLIILIVWQWRAQERMVLTGLNRVMERLHFELGKI